MKITDKLEKYKQLSYQMRIMSKHIEDDQQQAAIYFNICKNKSTQISLL